MPTWKVFIANPRASKGEQWLRLVARCKLDGKTVERTIGAKTADRNAAERLARVWSDDLNRGSSGDWTLTHAVEARARSFDSEGNAQEARGVRTALKKIGPKLGHLTSATMARSAVLLALDALRSEGASAGNLKTCFARIAAAWRWAEDRGHVTTPWPRVRLRAGKGGAKKRPYTDAEVSAILEWVKGYLGGRWLPYVQLLADTGRRAGEVVRLKGCDVDRKLSVIYVRQKGATEELRYAVPVPRETMALLPSVPPESYVFQQRLRPNPLKHIWTEAGRRVIGLAVTAIGIVDQHRLDQHSLRRAFVSSAERAGIPADVGRRVTGHRSRVMWDRYQAQTVGDDLRNVVEQVALRRRGPQPPPAPHQKRPAHKTSRRLNPGEVSQRGESNSRPAHYESIPNQAASPATGPAAGDPGVGGEANKSGPAWTRRERIGWELDPIVARLSTWADEDPAAMLDLLNSPGRQAQIRAALSAALPQIREPAGEPEQEDTA